MHVDTIIRFSIKVNVAVFTGLLYLNMCAINRAIDSGKSTSLLLPFLHVDARFYRGWQANVYWIQMLTDGIGALVDTGAGCSYSDS